MNKKIFHTLMKEPRPQQQGPEWMLFLEFCSMYLKNNRIKNPVVVELGIGEGRQKEFWEQLFGAEYIGIDISDEAGIPDILGNTHDPETLKRLKKHLNGKFIDILFIDASHTYEDVKKDYGIYSPLCDGIVALHDINTYRNSKRKLVRVWEFWDEIRGEAHEGSVVTIFRRRKRGAQGGIGMIIKKWI